MFLKNVHQPNRFKGLKETVTDKVTFKVTIGDVPVGTIELGLFGKKAPKTVENFLAFSGEGVDGHRYEGSTFHRIIQQFMIQGGDVVNGDGTGSISKFGSTFKDELPSHPHKIAGLLSMANRGPDTNGSQFFITTVPTPWLDGKHVVFGKVLDAVSMETVKKIEKTETNNQGAPAKKVRIIKTSVTNLQGSDRFDVDLD